MNNGLCEYCAHFAPIVYTRTRVKGKITQDKIENEKCKIDQTPGEDPSGLILCWYFKRYDSNSERKNEAFPVK